MIPRIYFIFFILFVSATGYADPSQQVIHTHVEQISATLHGQPYHAQLSEVRIANQGEDRTIVVEKLVIMMPDGTSKISDNISLETPVIINGEQYQARLRPVLNSAERNQAISIANNQIEWTRKNSAPAVANRVSSFPTYSVSAPTTNLNYSYRPYSQDNIDKMNRITESMAQHTTEALVGIRQNQSDYIQDTVSFQRQIEIGHQMAVQFSKEAHQSDINVSSRLSQFANQIGTLHDRETKIIAQRVAASDPYLQSVLSDQEDQNSNDIRSQTADVSPLNPNAQENIQKYQNRFMKNGLLREGVFHDEQVHFSATPLGHRALETANLFSDLAIREPELLNGGASSHLMGASYVYISQAIIAQSQNQEAKAEQFVAEGRRLTRALRGEYLPDDIEAAMTSRKAAIEMHETAIRNVLGLSGSGRELLTNAYAQVRPGTEEGRIAIATGQALLQNQRGLSDADIQDIGLILLDVGLGFVPVVGAVKSFVNIVAGYNVITGQPMTKIDYVLCAVDVLSAGGVGALLKVSKAVPEILGTAYKGSKTLLESGFITATEYARKYGRFIENSVSGLRQAEKYAPGIATQNLLTHPGAVLALGQNVHKYGGDEFAKNLMSYSAKESLSIVETAHISRFGGGYTRLVDSDTYEMYMKSAEKIAGKNGDAFFTVPTKEFEKLAGQLKTNEDLAKWIGVETPPHGFVRIDIPFDVSYGPRLPTGQESGVNQFFEKGGTAVGGAPELVIHPVPRDKVIIRGPVHF